MFRYFSWILKNFLKVIEIILISILIVSVSYVGFFSVVELAPNSKLQKLRVEGRRKGQSVLHVGNQFSAIVLNKEQTNYASADLKLGYLCGPPGSGKTVVLAVKARR